MDKLSELTMSVSSKEQMISKIKGLFEEEMKKEGLFKVGIITVKILNLIRIIQEDKVEVTIEFSVNHKILGNKSQILKVEFGNEKNYRQDFWNTQPNESKPDNC